MTVTKNSSPAKIRFFAYALLIWKIIIAIGVTIAGPIYERMSHSTGNDWFSLQIQIGMYVVGALAALLLIMEYRFLSLLLLFFSGSLLFVHYYCIQKINILSVIVAYWEFFLLSFMIWRMHQKNAEHM